MSDNKWGYGISIDAWMKYQHDHIDTIQPDEADAMTIPTPDTRRTMEAVFRAWLYREPLTTEERYRLMVCARDIERDAVTSWPHHALITRPSEVAPIHTNN